MYKPAFIQAYKASKSQLPIGTWAQVVGRRLPQFKSEEDIYSPIPISIKIAGSLNDSNGSVQLLVNPADEAWYPKLVGALEEMTGKRNLEVVNYLGEPLKDIKSTEALLRCGECDCVNKATQEPIRIQSVVPPPLHMSTNKQAKLREWWNAQREPLAEKIGLMLKDMNMSEIAKATLINGPVYETIKTHLESNTLHDMPWDSFISTYGCGQEETLENMSKKLLDATRQALVANEKQIRSHQAMVGEEANLWSTGAKSTSAPQDSFSLYRDIIEDAMYHPMVGQQMIQGIVYGSKIAKRVVGKKTQKKKKPMENMAHPLDAYYQQHHFATYGKLPGHRIEDLNKGITLKEYPGDAQRAVNMFNLFSGRAVEHKLNVMPLAEAIAQVDTLPIDCGVCGGAKKKKEKKVQSRMPELIPISAEMPRLVPIEGHAHKKAEKEKKERMVQSRMPELIPISAEMPRLVPIEGHAHKKEKDEKKKMVQSRMPELIPISAELPRLVPIEGGCSHGEKKDKKKKMVQSRMPELIPISAEMPRLVPIEGRHHKKEEKKDKYEKAESRMPELIPISAEMPRLVPIEGRAELPRLIPLEPRRAPKPAPMMVPSNDMLGQPIWVDDCPNLMDFLKK